jgi:biotin carboxylase
MQKHIVFVDSTLSGLLAFKSAKYLGCIVTFIHPMDSSFLAITTKDDSKIAPHLVNVDFYLPVPTISGVELLSLLRCIHLDRPIDAVITTSEAAIIQVASAAEELGLSSPSLESLKRGVFKNSCRNALRNSGVRSPVFEVLSEANLLQDGPQSISLPFVIKPTRGFGKQFSVVCKSQKDYVEFIDTLQKSRLESEPMINLIVNNEYIVEQYIEGSLHSAEVIVRNGKIECFATTTRYRSDYNELLEIGYTMPAGFSILERKELQIYLQEVFNAVDIDFGLYHVEIMLAKDGFYLVEINGRMMGGVGPQVYQTLSGIDSFDLLIKLYLNENFNVDESAINKSATVILIGSKKEGVISCEFSKIKLNLLLKKYAINFCSLNLQPNQTVCKLEGNVSTLGHIIVEEDEQESSVEKGYKFLLELDRLLGVEVAKYSYFSNKLIPDVISCQ